MHKIIIRRNGGSVHYRGHRHVTCANNFFTLPLSHFMEFDFPLRPFVFVTLFFSSGSVITSRLCFLLSNSPPAHFSAERYYKRHDLSSTTSNATLSRDKRAYGDSGHDRRSKRSNIRNPTAAALEERGPPPIPALVRCHRCFTGVSSFSAVQSHASHDTVYSSPSLRCVFTNIGVDLLLLELYHFVGRCRCVRICVVVCLPL